MKTTSNIKPAKITVKQQKEIGSENWGIYLNGSLYEGGFFDKYYAELGALKLKSEIESRESNKS